MRIEVKPHERYEIWREANFSFECWLVIGCMKYEAEVWHKGRRIRHGNPAGVINDNIAGNAKISQAVNGFRLARLFVMEMNR